VTKRFIIVRENSPRFTCTFQLNALLVYMDELKIEGRTSDGVENVYSVHIWIRPCSTTAYIDIKPTECIKITVEYYVVFS